MLRQKQIAVIVETSKGHGRGLLGGIGQYARRSRRWAVRTEERGHSDPIPRWFEPSKFDGVLFRTPDPEALRTFAYLTIPAVYLGDKPHEALTTVCPDQHLVAAAAAQHLLTQGFTRFAYIGIMGLSWSDLRRDAFVEETQQAGFKCQCVSPVTKTLTRPDWGIVQDQIETWIHGVARPIGVMCSNDIMARALLEVCRRNEISVPEEVAVVGVDNDELICEFHEPSLTSVALDTARIGATAAELLDDLMAGAKGSVSVTIPPIGIVKRQSTDIVAIEEPRVAAALGFMRRYACDGINVEDVLDAIPISRSTLERSLRHVIGRTPLAELNRVRLEHAKRMLEDTDLKLDLIAVQCGFAHTPHMIRQFSQQYGISPGQYRRSLSPDGLK